MTEPIFFEGDVLGRYRIERQLHVGTYGTLYLASRQPANTDVFIHVPGSAVLSSRDRLKQIVSAAEAWVTLGAHPHVLQCLEILTRNDVPLIVCEHIEGQTLADWIAATQGTDVNTSLGLAVQCGHALEHLHDRRVIHGRLRPRNLLVTRRGILKVSCPRVGESIAKAIASFPGPSADRVRHTGVNACDDIRDFGLCLYEMFCGRRPDAAVLEREETVPEPRALRSDIALPRALCVLIKRCVAPDPRKRPSASELAVELCAIHEAAGADATIHAPVPAGSEELSRPSRSGQEPGVSPPNTSEFDIEEIEAALNAGMTIRMESAGDSEIERSIEEFIGEIQQTIPDEGPNPEEAGDQPKELPAQSPATEADRKFSEAVTLNNLAEELNSRGEWARAEPVYREALRVVEEAVGPKHPYIAVGLKGLADLYAAQGDLAKAEPLYERLLAVQEKGFGGDSPSASRTIQKLLEVYRKGNKTAKAEALSRRVHPGR